MYMGLLLWCQKVFAVGLAHRCLPTNSQLLIGRPLLLPPPSFHLCLAHTPIAFLWPQGLSAFYSIYRLYASSPELSPTLITVRLWNRMQSPLLPPFSASLKISPIFPKYTANQVRKTKE